MTRKRQEGIWDELHSMYKAKADEKTRNDKSARSDARTNRKSVSDGFYIIPCDDCKHFGNCKYEKECDQDVRTGNKLRYFSEEDK